MNITETNPPGTKPLSAAESQLMQSSLLMMSQAHADTASNGPAGLSATPTLSGLLHALRRRWALALGLAVVASALTVAGVFFAMPPKYNVVLRLRVVARQAGAEDVEFPIFKANMEALVRNPLVLNAALNDKTSDGREIKDLGLVRAKGLSVNEWLEKNLKTDFNLGPEVLRVTLAADQADEAAELLNAIARAFFNEYGEMERLKKQTRLDDLRRQKDRMEDDVRKQRLILNAQINALPFKDREAMSVQQMQWIDKLRDAERIRRLNQDEVAKAESKIATAEARLKNVDKQQIPDELLLEFYMRDPVIQGYEKRIVDIDLEIEKLYQKLNEPYFQMAATPLKHEKIKVRKTKVDRETLLKPQIEVRWRKSVRADLEHQIAVAQEEVVTHKRLREIHLKEVQELEKHVKDSGTGANKPAQIQATEDKIEQARKASDHTAQRISETELEMPQPRVIPITPAAPPLNRDRTQQTKVAGAGGLGIFMLALFGVAFMEFRSRKISLTEEVTGLGLKVLGTVPAMPTRSKKASSNDSAGEALWLNQLQESVDAIRTVLMHQARTESLHVIMVTSANSGEGKTTLASQLAASLSRAWKRTLIIDADLRHPGTHTLFDTPQEPGFAEVLRGEVEPADAIRATSYSRLWVLPAGNGDNHAIQALAQDSVRTLFEQLKQQYDFIIIDSPPVLPVTDSLLVGQHVDGVVFAILSDVSRAPAVYAAQQKLAPLNVTSLGAVVLGTEQEYSDKNYRYALNTAGKK